VVKVSQEFMLCYLILRTPVFPRYGNSATPLIQSPHTSLARHPGMDFEVTTKGGAKSSARDIGPVQQANLGAWQAVLNWLLHSVTQGYCWGLGLTLGHISGTKNSKKPTRL
jgi:hypothetical protein